MELEVIFILMAAQAIESLMFEPSFGEYQFVKTIVT